LETKGVYNIKRYINSSVYFTYFTIAVLAFSSNAAVMNESSKVIVVAGL